jgi:hypothetical protein
MPVTKLMDYMYNSSMEQENINIHLTNNTVDEKYLRLIQLGSDEKVICAIRKHPIGLISIYLSGISIALVVIFASAIIGGLIQQQLTVSLRIDVVVMLLGLLVGLVSLFFTYVAGFIYQNNIIILTNEKVAQILYSNLINRKISQISLGELQDITVDQTGILARIFKFGTLVLETSGDAKNCNFTYARYPYDCAKELVDAHEASIKRYGN